MIADNDSTDITCGAVDYFTDELPLRKILEPRPGLSIARNLAVAEVQTDYVMFADDDVIVPTDWILIQAFQSWLPLF